MDFSAAAKDITAWLATDTGIGVASLVLAVVLVEGSIAIAKGASFLKRHLGKNPHEPVVPSRHIKQAAFPKNEQG